MSKLNLDDVLVMCLGSADKVDFLLGAPERETFRELTVRVDGVD